MPKVEMPKVENNFVFELDLRDDLDEISEYSTYQERPYTSQ